MRRVSKLAMSAVVAAAFAAVSVPAAPAAAASTIRSPHPPEYPVEIEPHLILQPDGVYYAGGTTGIGIGARFSIPIMSPGFVKTINDSIAISFGPDLLHYEAYNYCYGGVCSGNSFWRLYFPVAMQWNFWLTDKWSVFGEPGLVVRSNLGDNCVAGAPCRQSNIAPAFWAGARFHFSDRIALTMRVGFPEAVSVGVSFF
jgi:hypothetical protein